MEKILLAIENHTGAFMGLVFAILFILSEIKSIIVSRKP